jgi:hypothetical protein
MCPVHDAAGPDDDGIQLDANGRRTDKICPFASRESPRIELNPEAAGLRSEVRSEGESGFAQCLQQPWTVTRLVTSIAWI